MIRDRGRYRQEWEDRLTEVTGWPGFTEREVKRYILLDESQTTYWDNGFWNEFIKLIQEPSFGVRLVLFCSYERGFAPDLRNWRTTPPFIGGRACIFLQPRMIWDDEPFPGLLLTRAEYDEVVTKRAKILRLQCNLPACLQLGEDLKAAIYDWTSGHVGAVISVLETTLKQVRLRSFQIH